MNFTALALPGIQTLHPYIPGKPIATLKRELGITGEIIKLASNENPLGVTQGGGGGESSGGYPPLPRRRLCA